MQDQPVTLTDVLKQVPPHWCERNPQTVTLNGQEYLVRPTSQDQCPRCHVEKVFVAMLEELWRLREEPYTPVNVRVKFVRAAVDAGLVED